MADEVENILSNLGLSCDDLLSKLLQYKNTQVQSATDKSDNTKTNENSSLKTSDSCADSALSKNEDAPSTSATQAIIPNTSNENNSNESSNINVEEDSQDKLKLNETTTTSSLEIDKSSRNSVVVNHTEGDETLISDNKNSLLETESEVVNCTTTQDHTETSQFNNDKICSPLEAKPNPEAENPDDGSKFISQRKSQLDFEQVKQIPKIYVTNASTSSNAEIELINNVENDLDKSIVNKNKQPQDDQSDMKTNDGENKKLPVELTGIKIKQEPGIDVEVNEVPETPNIYIKQEIDGDLECDQPSTSSTCMQAQLTPVNIKQEIKSEIVENLVQEENAKDKLLPVGSNQETDVEIKQEFKSENEDEVVNKMKDLQGVEHENINGKETEKPESARRRRRRRSRRSSDENKTLELNGSLPINDNQEANVSAQIDKSNTKDVVEKNGQDVSSTFLEDSHAAGNSKIRFSEQISARLNELHGILEENKNGGCASTSKVKSLTYKEIFPTIKPITPADDSNEADVSEQSDPSKNNSDELKREFLKKYSKYKMVSKSHIPRKNNCEYYTQQVHQKICYRYRRERHRNSLVQPPRPDKEEVRGKIMEQLMLLRTRRAKNFVEPSKIPVEVKAASVEKNANKAAVKKRSPTPEQPASPEETMPEKIESESSIRPTKTKDVTKIKGWKNKKFTSCPVSTVMECDSTTSPENSSHPVDANSSGAPVESKEALKDDRKDLSTHSAFLSDVLDGFLASPDLNISYEIPKLTIEKSKKSKGDMDSLLPLVPLVHEAPRIQERVERPKVEKRFKARTVAEKKKLEMEAVLQHSKRPKLEPELNTVIEDEVVRPNYMHFADKRLIVRTRSRKDIFTKCYLRKMKISPKKDRKKEYIYVPYYKRRSQEFKHYKPSIFNHVLEEEPGNQPLQKIKYKAGPLCKKVKLQDTSTLLEWKSAYMSLPQVHVDVYPQYGVPIHPALHNIVTNNSFLVTNNQIELAVSAISPMEKDTVPRLTYPIPYKNQQTSILVRQRLSHNTTVKCEKLEVEPETLSIEDTVKNMVGNMLDYVEIKEIQNDLAKPDPDSSAMECSKSSVCTTPDKKKHGRFEVMNKKIGRRSKTSLELKRLNVKVIEVDIEEKNSDKPCKKPECSLGCVCHSLNSLGTEEKHCGQPKCMFECICNFGSKSNTPKVSLPHGTDLLSAGTLHRLQNEAKKNLARVEKEFTQTVIQAKNQTIVVPGSSERSRRVTKAPKKYQDFIEIVEPAEPAVIPEEIKTPESKLKKCAVNVTRLDLSDLVPLCLLHNKYDCKCNGVCDAVPKPRIEKIVSEVEISDDSDDPDYKNYQYYMKKKKAVRLQREPAVTAAAVKPVDNTAERDYCMRTKGISSNILFRNKVNLFKNIRRRKLNLEDDRLTFLEAEPANFVNVELLTETKGNRRKQMFNTRYDHCERVVKTVVVKDGQNKPDESKSNNIIPEEADISSKLRTTVNTMLGRKTDCKIMPYKMLLTKYRDGAFNIWYAACTKPKLFCTNYGVPVPSNYINLKKFENVTIKKYGNLEIMQWLLTKYLPRGNVMVILNKVKPCIWEICGTIEDKNCKFVAPQINAAHSPVRLIVGNEGDVGANAAILPDRPGPLMAPAKYRRKNEIWYYKSTFTEKELMYNGIDLKAALPKLGKHQRWVMIPINNKVLSVQLRKTTFDMKLVDIRKLLAMARDCGQTIVVHVSEMERIMKEFGIYACPFLDLIFTGPYNHTDESNIDLLIKPCKQIKNHVSWVYEKPKSDLLIDLTDEGPSESPQNYDSLLKKMKFTTQQLSTILEKTNEVTKSMTKPLTLLTHKLGKDVVIKTQKIADTSPNLKVIVPKAQKVDDTSPNLNVIVPKAQKVDDTSPNLKVIVPKAQKVADTSPNLNVIVPKAQKVDDTSPNLKVIVPKAQKVADTSPNLKVTVPKADDAGTSVSLLKSSRSNPEVSKTASNKLYMITNLPCLGYIEGQTISTKMFRIHWQSKEKSYIDFNNKEEAKWWFKDKVEKGLHIVPKSFELKVDIVKTKAPSLKPFDNKWLLESCIVGSFGIINYLTATETVLKSLGMSEEDYKEVLRKKEDRSIIIESMKCYGLFMEPSEIKKHLKNTGKLIKMLIAEIRRLQEEDEELQNELKDISMENVQHKIKVVKMIKGPTPLKRKRPIPALTSILKKQEDKPSGSKENPILLSNSASAQFIPLLSPMNTNGTVKTQIKGQVIHLKVVTKDESEAPPQ